MSSGSKQGISAGPSQSDPDLTCAEVSEGSDHLLNSTCSNQSTASVELSFAASEQSHWGRFGELDMLQQSAPRPREGLPPRATEALSRGCLSPQLILDPISESLLR